MLDDELSSYLALSFCPGIGDRNFGRLASYRKPSEVVHLASKELQYIGFKPNQIEYLRNSAVKDVETCLMWRDEDKKHHIITLLDQEYPEQLRQIGAPPPVLFVKGNLKVLSEPQLAIVGSRNASHEGLANARRFAVDLSKKGLVITSGMALGIDGHAHDGALKSKGETVAVLGAGINNLYPSRHRELAERIVDNGALVSQFWPNALPKPKNFPKRNRIISGLSLGVLVIEAAQRSGSLITARYAAEQGREVFALPGSIHNANTRGGNALIKEGACLVQSSSEMFEEMQTLLNWSINQQNSLIVDEVKNEQLPFPELLANVEIDEVVSVDILAQRTHIPVHEILIQLLELELQGHVAAVSGGYIRTRRS